MKGFLLIFLIILPGCTATSDYANSNVEFEDIAKICMKSTGQSNALAVQVPSASNPVANSMVVAALKMGSSSTAVDELLRLLTLPSNPPIVVFGNNDTVVAATIEAALAKLPANALRPQQVICVSNKVQLTPSLQQTAKAANVHLLAVHN